MWLVSEGVLVVFDGIVWWVWVVVEGLLGVVLCWDIVEFDYVIGMGVISDMVVLILV